MSRQQPNKAEEPLDNNSIISSLWSPASTMKCRIGLVDTVLYENGLPSKYYLTGSTGEVRLKKSLDLSKVSKRWKQIYNEFEPPYILIIKQNNELLKFLSYEAYENFLSEWNKPNISIISLHCFLGYKSTNSSTIIYRNNYQYSLQTQRISTSTQTYSIPIPNNLINSSSNSTVNSSNNGSESNFTDNFYSLYENKIIFNESKASSLNKVTDLATSTVIRYVEKMLKIQFLQLSVDYVVDKKSQIWMLWCTKAIIKRQSIDPNLLGNNASEYDDDDDENMKLSSPGKKKNSSKNLLNNEENKAQILSNHLIDLKSSHNNSSISLNSLLTTSSNQNNSNSSSNTNSKSFYDNNFSFTPQESNLSTKSSKKSKKFDNKEYPSPFLCKGDYCKLDIIPSSMLGDINSSSEANHHAIDQLALKFFTKEEIQKLKAKDINQFYTMFNSASSIPSSTSSSKKDMDKYKISLKSIKLARHEQRGLLLKSGNEIKPVNLEPWKEFPSDHNKEVHFNTTSGGATNSSFSSSSKFNDTEVDLVSESLANTIDYSNDLIANNINNIESILNNPATYYETVSVCPVCYSVYCCLDWARGLLHNTNNNMSDHSQSKVQRSKGLPNTQSLNDLKAAKLKEINDTNSGLLSQSLSLPSLKRPHSSNQELSILNKKKGSWKHSVDKKSNKLSTLDSYIRGNSTLSQTANSDNLELKHAWETDQLQKQDDLHYGRVLLACSSTAVIDSILNVLNSSQFNVSISKDGYDTNNKVLGDLDSFDCLLIEKDLPLVDAFQVVKNLRLHERDLRRKSSNPLKNSQRYTNNRLPVVILTSETSPADLSKYMRCDMDGCVSLPNIDPAALLSTMRAAIPHHLAPIHRFSEITEKEKEEMEIKRGHRKIMKVGPLGELEGSDDSASVALRGLPIAQHEAAIEFEGVCQLDADTKLPFMVIHGEKFNRLHGTNNQFFNLIVCHDLFDTMERLKILLQPITQKYQTIQILVWNYPGQGGTEFRPNQLLNNEYHAHCLNSLLGQIGDTGSGDFQTNAPFYFLGIGYGASVAAYYLAHYRVPNVRGLIQLNGFTFVDSYLAGVMHDCINVFESSPSNRPDLPIYFFSRFLFSKKYLAKVGVPLALNIYTAVFNSITLKGRIQLCKGVLQSVDLRPLLNTIDCPIICLQSVENMFSRSLQVEPLVKNRGGIEARSIKDALQSEIPKTCVIWLQGGHEALQECKKQVLLLLEQVLTGYHELHEVTFPSASSMNLDSSYRPTGTGSNFLPELNQTNQGNNSVSIPLLTNQNSIEDKFAKSVLNLTKNTFEDEARLQNKPSTSINSKETMNNWANYSDKIIEKQQTILTSSSNLTLNKSQKLSTQKSTNNLNSTATTTEELISQASQLKEKSKTDIISELKYLVDVQKLPEVKEYMAWRLKRNKKRLQRLQLAALTIQSAYRAYLSRNFVNLVRRKKAAINIQRVFRGWKGRKKFFFHVQKIWATILIQKIYRGHRARIWYYKLLIRIAAATLIQKRFRGILGRERVRKIKKRRYEAACIIQAMARRYQSRIQAWLRRHFRNCAITIQRVYRGVLGRRRAQMERDKFIFSKSQAQGIEFGRQMLLEHKLQVTRLQSEVSLLTQEKVSCEEQIEALLEEITTFEDGVRLLEKEMHQLSKIEAEASIFMDDESKIELREQKMRLDKEFGEMLLKINNRKELLNDLEKKLGIIDKGRQVKEEELRILERKLVVLLEDQQKELENIKKKQDVRGALLNASQTEINRISAANPSAGGPITASNSRAITDGNVVAAPVSSGPSIQEKQQAAQLMQSTETLMRFGFMSMSMTYFSSLNMIKALRTVSAQDTVMAALSDVHAQRAVGLTPGMEEPSNAMSLALNNREMASGNTSLRLKPGQLPGQQMLSVASWSVEDVAKWLQTLSLGQYCECFMDAAIDGEFLYDLNDDDLKNTLGIEHRLHRKKILSCIQKLKVAEVQNESRLGKLQNVLNNSSTATGFNDTNNNLGYNLLNDVNTDGFNGNNPANTTNKAFGLSSMSPDYDDRLINGPTVSLSELVSYVRHSKLPNLKDAIDYLPNKLFDTTLVENPYVPNFGTIYVAGYDSLVFHINKTDDHGNTLLSQAAQNGNLKIAKYLISKGANINHQNKQGQTPAHFAIAFQFFDFSQYLFENGASDLIENMYGLTPYDGLLPDYQDNQDQLLIEN